MMKKFYILFVAIGIVAIATSAYAQNAVSVREKYMQRMQQARENYSSMREKCNMEYANMLRQEWDKFDMHAPDTIPFQEQIIPKQIEHNSMPMQKDVIIPGEIISTDLFGFFRPEPVEKVEETKFQSNSVLDFTFCGTKLNVRIPNKRIYLKGIQESSIADMWEKFSKKDYNNLIYDCLEIRDRHNLCDWAYLQMIQALSDKFYEGYINESTLLTAYIYAQSGYKIRIALCNQELMLLYASRYSIFGMSYFEIGGEKFYAAKDNESSNNVSLYNISAHVSNASMQKEMPLSLNINKNIILDIRNTEPKGLKAEKYPEINTSIAVNKNLLDFYDTYPRSQLGNSIATQWITYANTPMSDEAKKQLYPVIKLFITGKDTTETLNSILNFCQTAFSYMKDNDTWGYDRPFFADETLYYPFCDCEDRSILFARIVRDILGYEVVLIHYPNHLACGVKIDSGVEIPGDYVIVGNKEYIVCDPTYIGASIGLTMPECKGQKINVIEVD